MAGLDAFGAALAMSDMASSPTFTDAANVQDISGPGMSIAEINVTAHDSTDGFKEYIGGVGDGGTITFDLNWDPGEASHAAMLAVFYAKSVVDWTITLSDGSIVDFSGLISGWEPSNPVEGKITASVTIRTSGKPAFTAASSS
jgi:predicted secreted protein